MPKTPSGETDFFDDQEFTGVDFSKTPLKSGFYENCRFSACGFYKAKLSNITFEECIFTGCDLSLTVLHQTYFRNAQFIRCKMVGMPFDRWADARFSAAFDQCTLDVALFRGSMLKKAVFRQCSLKEVDFSGADASACIFDGCDLQLARFERTVLTGADFSTSFNIAFDPEINRLSGAKFAQSALPGLLLKYGIIIT